MRNKIFYLFIFIFIISIIVSCSKSISEKKSIIIGKIINPKKDVFIVSEEPFGIYSDTIRINRGNKFKGTVKTPDEGLYFMFVFPEFQNLYLKKNDSLAFIVNTNEFDESLSFSGKSGFENNMLNTIFLMNEKESYNIQRKFSTILPQELLNKLDSFYDYKQKYIFDYKNEFNNTSAKYKKILELYNKVFRARLLEKYVQQYPDSFPKNFFEYRKILKQNLVEVNIPDLIYFAKTYIDNKLTKKTKKDKLLQAVKIINDDIADKKLRDIILMLFYKNYLQKNFIFSTNDEAVISLKKNINNPVYLKTCMDIVSKNNKLKKGNKIPNVQIIDELSKNIQLYDVLSKDKSLIVFWDFYYRKNFKSNLEKLKKYKNKYPELNIIFINLNIGNFKDWKSYIPENMNMKFYQLKNHNDINTICPNNFSKVLLLNYDTIKHSNINMYMPAFETVVEKFMKK